MHYPATTRTDSSMRIAPRTLLCGSAWRRFHDDISARFEELRELCAQAGDKASLAVGMAGMVIENMHHGRIAEASRAGVRVHGSCRINWGIPR